MVILMKVLLDEVEEAKLQYPGSYVVEIEKSGFCIIEIPVVESKFHR